MGYRSDMYALVHGSDLIKFQATLKEVGLEDCFNVMSELDDEGYMRFISSSCLKWYDGYSDVDAVNAVFNSSQHSILLRVGEEAEDYEYYSGNRDLQERFDISVTVEVDF